jgi:hypothetical protein
VVGVVGCGTLRTTVPGVAPAPGVSADAAGVVGVVGGVVSVVVGGGVVAVVVVGVVVSAWVLVGVVDDAGGGGVSAGVCTLGSWVESVVTSVTGGVGLATVVGCVLVGDATVELGTVAATVFGGPVGLASFGLRGARRRATLTLLAATSPAEEIVTGCELVRVRTGSLACVTGRAAAAPSVWW